ncbi:DoxX family protein [Maribacter sp. LLG6340-A2]|uniref:DoxX family protein n=1 Tax=Maribacter sp. LLG6340-A2 TaxID=3160834 RepID=UPI00386FBBBB
MNFLNLAILVSSIAFLYYGLECLFSQKMKDEFTRFGLKQQRVLTAYLQLTGAIGLIFGFFVSPMLTLISAAGLSLLMFLGFGVRIKIKDSISESLPALVLALINLFIAYKYYQ